MNEQETLEAFFSELKKENALYEDVKKFITFTQQEEAKIVGKTNVYAHIDGISQLVKQCKEIKVKEKVSTNKLLKTFKVSFIGEGTAKMECTVIKESGIRQSKEDGIWGVNVQSFKLIKP